MKNYMKQITYVYGHYDVKDIYGTFIESCDTYEEAQDAVDRLYEMQERAVS